MPALIPTNIASPPRMSRSLKVGFWLCIGIGIGISLRRLIALQRYSTTSGPLEMARLDAWFQSHAALTYIHIFTALLFLSLLLLNFWEHTKRASAVRIGYYGVGAILAITAYGMSAYSVGGWWNARLCSSSTRFSCSLSVSVSVRGERVQAPKSDDGRFDPQPPS